MQNTQGSVFRRVCQQGNVELARQILATGVDIDAAQEDGCTALWLAAEAGQVSSVMMLCEHEANLEAVKVPANVTPLYIACQNGHLGVVDVLLMHSANPNTTKSNGSTPLHIAAQQGFVDVCRILLRYGAKHSPRNIQGVIPLHLAAYQGNEKVVRLLLAAGADAQSESQGKFTIDWAFAGGHGKVIQKAVEEVTGKKMAQEEHRDAFMGVTGGIAGSTDTSLRQMDASPAAASRSQQDLYNTPGHTSMGMGTPMRSAMKQPFMVQIRDDQDLFPQTSGFGSGVVNAHQPMSGWYQPSFLNQTAAGSPVRDVDASVARSNHSINRMPAAGMSTSSGKGGFVATSLPLSAAIQREAERNQAFRNRTTNNVDAGAHNAGDAGDMFKIKGASAVKAVDDSWAHFKRRLENQRNFLNNTRNNIPDGWMYNSNAVDGYRREINEARVQLEKAAEEGRAMVLKKADARTSNCVGLDEEYVSRLRAFVIEGEGAKPPVAPEGSLDQEDLALQPDPPSPGQFRAAHENPF